MTPSGCLPIVCVRWSLLLVNEGVVRYVPQCTTPSLSLALSHTHTHTKTQFTLTKTLPSPPLPASNQQLAAAFAPVATRHGIGADFFFEDEGDVAMTKLCAQYRGKIPDEVSHNRDTTNTNPDLTNRNPTQPRFTMALLSLLAKPCWS